MKKLCTVVCLLLTVAMLPVVLTFFLTKWYVYI